MLDELREHLYTLEADLAFARGPKGEWDFASTGPLREARALRARADGAEPLACLGELVALEAVTLWSEEAWSFEPTWSEILGKLPRLSELSLSELGGPSEGLAHVGEARGLRSLRVMLNSSLLAPLYKALTKLGELEELQISRDETGELDSLDFLGGLPALDRLALRGFRLPPVTEALAPLAASVGLRELDLSGLRGCPDLSPLASLAGLEVLKVKLSEVQTLPELPALRSLDLGFSRVSSLLSLRASTRLSQLRLQSLDLDSGLAGLEALPLESLDLGSIPELPGLACLQQKDSLRSLDLKGNPGLAAPSAEAILASFTKLVSLNLAGTRCQGSTLVALSGLQELERLDLSDTSPGAEGLAALATGFPALANLDLSASSCDDAMIPALLRLGRLDRLDLEGIWISVEGQAELRAGLSGIAHLAVGEESYREDPEYGDTFVGLQVIRWPMVGLKEGVAVLLSAPEEGCLASVVGTFAQEEQAAAIAALVLEWIEDEESESILGALLAQAGTFRSLRHLCLGDPNPRSGFEQCEGDLRALLLAYPRLETLQVSASDDLRFSPLLHEHLRKLTISPAPDRVLESLVDQRLPRLERLELGRCSAEDEEELDRLLPLLSGKLFPALKELDLPDAHAPERLAQVLAGAPLLERLEHLGLAGSLGDPGGEALLGSPALRRLRSLDLRDHELSPVVRARFEALDLEVSLGARPW